MIGVLCPRGAPDESVLEVRDLRVDLTSGATVVNGVSVSLSKREALGIVGESGCGKSTFARALLGYASAGTKIVGGSIYLQGRDLLVMDEDRRRGIRRTEIAYVPQEPAASLTPSLRVLNQVLEVAGNPRHGSAEVERVLSRVQLPTSKAFIHRFPHQLSGGQQQRLGLAMALVREPAVLVLDEPTTGLDAVTKQEILLEIERIRTQTDLAIVHISHDLSVVAQVTDRIAVMYAGRIVELGPSREVIENPRHPYTQVLIGAIPDPHDPRLLRSLPGVAPAVHERPDECAFAPRCPFSTAACRERVPALESAGPERTVRCVHWRSISPAPREALPKKDDHADPASQAILAARRIVASYGKESVCHEVSLYLDPGECLALVGESGSGKSTFARTLLGLHPRDSGELFICGEDVNPNIRKRSRDQRQRIQIVFQDPYSSLNPRQSVESIIARPMRLLRELTGQQASEEVSRLMSAVRLPEHLRHSRPSELSGGERQRVALARALAPNPEILVCDEITSALDVSVQATILDLLAEMRTELSVAILFITHDLGVVAAIADRVVVMESGIVRETGAVRSVLGSPEDAYTRRLLDAAPSLSRAASEANRQRQSVPRDIR